MKIAIGSDHAGYHLKEKIKKYLDDHSLDYKDFGTFKIDPCDYPEYAFKVGISLIQDDYDRGILICGTGIGMCIAANKIKGIRAALVYDNTTAKMSRLHNDSNVICLGGRLLNEKEMPEILNIWLNTSFEGGRHQKRVDLIKNLSGK